MHFLRNSRPTSAEITQLSEDLEMERETVRVWFCNRRQKEKRIGSHGEVKTKIYRIRKVRKAAYHGALVKWDANLELISIQ